MNHFLQHYTLKYTTLSPIHIGTGDSYEPTNYVIDNGTLYEFGTSAAVLAFTDNDRNDLMKIVNKPANEEMLKSVQKFFYERRGKLKPWTINAIPVLGGVAEFYGKRVGQTTNREGDGKGVINKLEIDRTAYNPVTRQPVLFGSSVKGAIRTALLSHKNSKQSLKQIEGDRTGKSRKENHKELQQRLFEFQSGKFELDPLRLLQISDAEWCSQEQLPSAQVLVSVNRKKMLKRDKVGNEIYSQAEKNENLCKLLECVPALHYRSFRGQLNLQRLDSLTQNSKMPNSNLRFTIEQIAKYCSGFYLPKLKSELNIMRERGFLDQEWDKSIQRLLQKLTDKILKGEVFLLRVGRHSGAESVTIDGVKHIKILKGTPEYQPETKTLWLAASQPKQRTGLLPFGWLLVEIQTETTGKVECQELADICHGQHIQAKKWAEQNALQQAEFSKQRKELEANLALLEEQRRQGAEQRQRELEQKHKAEEAAAEALRQQQVAERQRLASLSPLESEIEAFLKTIPAQEHDTRLLQELEKGRWQGDDIKIVAQNVRALMEKTGKWMPDFTGENKQKLKLKERSQKVVKYLKEIGNP